jgi:hypothetical protein
MMKKDTPRPRIVPILLAGKPGKSLHLKVSALHLKKFAALTGIRQVCRVTGIGREFAY